MANRVGRPESAWRPFLAYSAMIVTTLVIVAPLIWLAWRNAS